MGDFRIVAYAITHLYLTYLQTFTAIIFVYKVLLVIGLDDYKRRSPLPPLLNF